MDDRTIEYYDQHAGNFIASTVGADMSTMLRSFLDRIPAGGRVLDWGCGSGRDSLAMAREGFDVVPVDLSEAMADATENLTGLTVRRESFSDLASTEEFDGIWACSSLLHAGRDELPALLEKACSALKPGGVLYLSFKYGEHDGMRNGRWFTDLTTDALENLIEHVEGLVIDDSWVSGDVRPGRSDEKWLNAFLLKSPDGSTDELAVDAQRAIGEITASAAMDAKTKFVTLPAIDLLSESESNMDGLDYVLCCIAALASTYCGTSEKFEKWLAQIHDASSGKGGDYDRIQLALGKLFSHDHDRMDWMVTRTDEEDSSYRLFHRLFWGHDPLSWGNNATVNDNPFVLMFTQKSEESGNGFIGILQAARHLAADTFSKQGLPIPGSSHLDYIRETDGGKRPWNYLIDVVQTLSVETYGDKKQAEQLYEHLFTVRAQDAIGGLITSAFVLGYLKSRKINDAIRIAQIKLTAYSMAFFLEAAVGASKQRGVPYINAPLGMAMFGASFELLKQSNSETNRLQNRTEKLISEKDRLLQSHDRIALLLDDELE